MIGSGLSRQGLLAGLGHRRLRYWGSILGLLGGAALGALFLHRFGLVPVLELMEKARAGLAVVLLVHGAQILLTGMAWRRVSRCLAAEPGLAAFTLLRWLREGINSLLPVAQLGGPVLAIRLLRRRGLKAALATAGVIVDTSVEMVTQIAFTLAGLALLAAEKGASAMAPGAVMGFSVLSGITAAAVAAQGLGGARILERAASRLGWHGGVEGLHEAIMSVYRRPRAVAAASACHLAAWLLGGAEVALAFHFFGQDIAFGPALVIESLGLAIRSAAFPVPAGLGVQEGGYILVCDLLGLSPELALALSLTKRLRDLVYGVPSIGLWLWLEGRSQAERGGEAQEASPADAVPPGQ